MNRIIVFLIGLLIPASKPCLPAWPTILPSDLPLCLQAIPVLEPKIKFVNFFLRKPEIADVIKLIDQTKPLLPHLDYFLGNNQKTTYLILLQNNYEMRANGGFFGSYAVANVDKGEVAIRFQDIYVPDGALPGHVEPPSPIQTAFKQGWFKLRDSDWEPDFTKAAGTIRWFFEKGNEVNPDLLITLNLTTIEKMIKILGGVAVPEYDLTLTSDNLYTLLQNQAEMRAFQGSTQKKDVISAAGKAVTKKLSLLEFDQYVQLVEILLDQLNHGNLLINSQSESVQKVLEEKGWAGKISVPACGTNCISDTVMLVETNMGANKANCCIERKTLHTITKGETEITHLINLTFINKSVLENPAPPRFYGGNYISYLRFYLPENAIHIRLTAQPTLPKTLLQYPAPFDGISQKTFDLSDNYGLREVGFFHTTQAGTSSQIQLSYDLPLDEVSPGTVAPLSGHSSQVKPTYQLNLLKQHGMESSPQDISLFGKSYSTDLTSDHTEVSPL